MITKTKITIVALCTFLMSYSQAMAQEKQERKEKMEGTETHESHGKMGEWPALGEFHEVMAKTFHPSEEGNLKPIRERSSELHAKAVKLAESKIPASFNSKEIIEATKELSLKTKQLEELVKKNGSDEEVTKLLASTHDAFHKIVGLCSKDDDHEEKKEK